MQESRVFNLIVFFSDENEICFCEKDFSKACPLKAAENRQCNEMIVRFTPVEREISNQEFLDVEEEVIDKLNNSFSKFKKTLDHLKRGLS